jgi:hypothetical protein
MYEQADPPRELAAARYHVGPYVVVVDTDEVRAFGLTPQQAMGDFVRRELCYDGPVAEIYPCSPELYRQLEVTTSNNLLSIPCRIDSYGIAFPVKDRGPQSK